MVCEDLLVGVEYVAAHLSLNKGSIYSCIEKRVLPAHGIGHHLWRFHKDEVREWV